MPFHTDEPSPSFESEFWRIARAVGCGGGGAERVCAKVEADARALWAVRVLDAWYWRVEGWEGPTPAPEHCASGWFVYLHESHWGSDPDAARLAAAEAVFPELPADVRAKLGERP